MHCYLSSIICCFDANIRNKGHIIVNLLSIEERNTTVEAEAHPIDISIRLLLLLTFCCILCSTADDVKQQQLQSATVVGTVYCDTCFQQ